MEFEVRRDMIAKLENLFDVVINHSVNKPIKVCAGSYDIFDSLKLNDIEFKKIDFKNSCNGYIYEFNSNLFYKEIIRFSEDECKFCFKLYKEYIVAQDVIKNSYNYDDELNLLSEKIISVSYNAAVYKNINFCFDAFWKFDYLSCASFSLPDVLLNSVEGVKKSLPIKGDYKNFRVLDIDVKAKDYEWTALDDDSFALQAKCDLEMKLQFSYKVNRKESLKVCIQGNTSDVWKNLNYSLKLPCGPKIYQWHFNHIYFKSDLIVFEGKIYKCFEDHFSLDYFEKNNWKFVKSENEKNKSFCDHFSFFESEDGKKALNKINDDISLAYEKAAGDLITIDCVLDEVPKLNQFFVYMEKEFRVIQVKTILDGNIKKFTIIGREILKKIELSIQDFKFKQDEDLLGGEIEFVSEKRENKVFEGLLIKVPENLEINSYLEVQC